MRDSPDSEANTCSMARRSRPDPPMTFLLLKPVLLAMQARDRGYLRAWVRKYVSENGEVMMPNTAVDGTDHAASRRK